MGRQQRMVLIQIDRRRWGVLTDGDKLLIITSDRRIAQQVIHERTDPRQGNVPDQQETHDVGLPGDDDHIDVRSDP